MKFTIHRLRIGDFVWAQVMEVLSSGEIITSFHGDLIRVANFSNKNFSVGDKILVKVSAVHPLAFQIVMEGESRKGATRLNVSV